jgi:putative flippase GtrA
LTTLSISTIRNNTIITQFFRYTAVGGLAFTVDFSALFLLAAIANVHYLVSAALAFSLGLTTNYALSTSWVFNKHTLLNRHAEFIVFATIGLIGLALNEFLIWFFTETLLLHYLLSKIYSTVVVYICNFALRKIILFR